MENKILYMCQVFHQFSSTLYKNINFDKNIENGGMCQGNIKYIIVYTEVYVFG